MTNTTDRRDDELGTTLTDDALTLRRTYAASTDRVWRAWTDPAILTRWYCPNPDRELTVEADARVGGAYRVAMGPDVASGEYTVVDEPHVLEFTWAWAGDDETTTVRVELEEVAGGTRLTLTHSGFGAPASTQGHAEGWALSLDRLAGEVGDA